MCCGFDYTGRHGQLCPLLYSYSTDFNDYPKLGVWPDGYYITYNMFRNGATFIGFEGLCLWIALPCSPGRRANQQCVSIEQ